MPAQPLVFDATVLTYSTLPPLILECGFKLYFPSDYLWYSSQMSILFQTNAMTLVLKVSTNQSSSLTNSGTSDRSIFKLTKRRLPYHFRLCSYLCLILNSNEAAKLQGSGAGGELDEFKRMLTKTNPWSYTNDKLIQTTKTQQSFIYHYLFHKIRRKFCYSWLYTDVK